MTSTLGQRLTWTDGDLRMSQCALCRHKGRDATCSAFPGGIPAAILRNDVSHADPFDGDSGIQLEPIEITARLFEHITGLAFPARASATTPLRCSSPARTPVVGSTSHSLARF